MKTYDVEVERSVIGCLIAFDHLQDKTPLIEKSDFYYAEHQKLFETILEIYRETGTFDFIVASAKCDSNMRSLITACVNIVPSSANFDEYFRLLKEMASVRRLVNGFNDLAYCQNISVATVQDLIDSESERRLTTDVKATNEANLNRFVKYLNRKSDSLMTGFSQLDNVLGGIRKQTVFIIGARPSTGKTTFALNIAQNVFESGKKVMFFSLEMSSEMIYERLMSSKHRIEYENFSQNKLSETEIDLIAKETEEIKTADRLYVVDDVYSAEHICNLIIEQKPNLAVVDFMQIVSTIERFTDPRTKIDYISGMFKRTAKKVGCTIMVLSQMSRAGKDAPTMNELKESGGLEQDGDYIALLHRPYVLNKGDQSISPEQTDLLLDKNKFGQTGKINLWFDLKHQKFYEVDRRRESEIDCSGQPFDAEIEI